MYEFLDTSSPFSLAVACDLEGTGLALRPQVGTLVPCLAGALSKRLLDTATQNRQQVWSEDSFEDDSSPTALAPTRGTSNMQLHASSRSHMRDIAALLPTQS